MADGMEPPIKQRTKLVAPRDTTLHYEKENTIKQMPENRAEKTCKTIK